MYYLCGAGAILRFAGGLKKRVKVPKIRRFPVVNIMNALRTRNIFAMMKKCLSWSFWRAEKPFKLAKIGIKTAMECESRTRIAYSSFSAEKHTKNQIDNQYQTSYLGTLPAGMKQSHPSFGEVRMVRDLPICSSSCRQGDREDSIYPFAAIRRCLTSLMGMSSGHDGMVLARMRSTVRGMTAKVCTSLGVTDYFTNLMAMEA